MTPTVGTTIPASVSSQPHCTHTLTKAPKAKDCKIYLLSQDVLGLIATLLERSDVAAFAETHQHFLHRIYKVLTPFPWISGASIWLAICVRNQIFDEMTNACRLKLKTLVSKNPSVSLFPSRTITSFRFSSTAEFNELPAITEDCPYLQKVTISFQTAITAALVSQLRIVPALNSLRLGVITPELFPSLHQFSLLQDLRLKDCSLITDADFLHLRALKSLRKLRIEECNQMTEEGVTAALRPLVYLNKLTVCDRKMTGAGLADLTSLRQLSLSDCQKVSAIAFLQLSHFLEECKLCYCKDFDGPLNMEPGSRPFLKTLRLYDSPHIARDLLKVMPYLTALYSLTLKTCNISNRLIPFLKGMPALTELNLKDRYYNEITSIEDLDTLSALVNLNLSCSRIYRISLPSLSQLQRLKLSNCKQIPENSLRSLSVLTGLHTLDLSYCTQITDQGVRELTALIWLKTLFLFHCVRITNQSLSYFLSMPALRFVDATYSKVTDKEKGALSLITFKIHPHLLSDQEIEEKYPIQLS